MVLILPDLRIFYAEVRYLIMQISSCLETNMHIISSSQKVETSTTSLHNLSDLCVGMMARTNAAFSDAVSLSAQLNDI